MRIPLLRLLCVLTAYGCAQLPRGSPEHAARMQQAGESYTQCLGQHTEKNINNPAPAEEIALAAHGYCWSAWDAYREAARANFFFDTRTPEEKQLANDRTLAHLRDFEREARRVLVDSIIDRALPPRKVGQ